MSSAALTFRSLAGLGDQQTTQDIVTGVSTVGTAIAGAAAAGLLTGIGITAAAVPIIGPVVAGVALLLTAFHVGAGCGSSCTLSTHVVERIIPVMQQNLAAAQALLQQSGGCVAAADKAVCLKNFDDLWSAIVQGCSQVGGTGGSQCIADRQRGGKYDCFVTLRDPISEMKTCANPPASQMASVMGWAGGSSDLMLPLGLGLIVAAVILFGKR